MFTIGIHIVKNEISLNFDRAILLNSYLRTIRCGRKSFKKNKKRYLLTGMFSIKIVIVENYEIIINPSPGFN